MADRDNDRRRTKRYRRRMKVRWWARDIEGRGFTVDVSNSGLLIETGRPIAIGTRLHLEVGLTDEIPYFTECVVARKRTYPPQARALFKPAVGVRFVSMNEAVREITERDGEECLGTQENVHVPLMVDLRDLDHLQAVYERDIKHGGLMVETTELPELNSSIEVPIWLPEPNPMIRCRGEVVKLFEDPPGLALRLEEIDMVRARLKEVLAKR